MTTWVEGRRSFFLGAQAWIIEDDREIASSWASQHLTHNPALKYTLGRFVEADRPNNNRQLFSLEGLQMARPTITHAPMNMNHSQRRVVGAYIAAELVYPTDTAASMDDYRGSSPVCEVHGTPWVLRKEDAFCPLCEPAKISNEDACFLTIDTIEAFDELARTFSADQRKKMAGEGKAMPDGSFPIDNEADLHNAIRLAGNAKNPAAARAHIKKRAAALGLSKLIPETWGGQAAAFTDVGLNPYIEALGVFWRHYFPEEYDLVEAAHAEGRLFYSMECLPAEIQCAGDGGCGQTFEYAGRVSPTYCDHLNKNLSDKFLIEPHFTAGAILVPPVSPGWSRADIHSLVAKHAQLAERIYDGVATELPHLSSREWEAAMVELLTLANR